MNAAETLVETLANLTKKGFTNNFIINGSELPKINDPRDFLVSSPRYNMANAILAVSSS